MATRTVESGAAAWAWSADGGTTVKHRVPASSADWSWGIGGTTKVLRPVPASQAAWVFDVDATDDLVRRELLPWSGVEVQVWSLADPNSVDGFLTTVQYESLKFERVLSDTGSCEVVLGAAYMGAEWLTRDNVLRFVVEGVPRWAAYIEDIIDEPVKQGEKKTITLVGRGNGKCLEWGAVAPAGFGTANQTTKRTWDTTTRGAVLSQLFDEIQSRGTLPFVDKNGWGATRGSNGELWDNEVDIEFDAGGSFAELLQKWLEFGFEWDMGQDFGLKVATRIGRDLTDRVRVYPANTVRAQKSTTTRRDLRTQMFAEDGNGGVTLIEDADAVEAWGQREQYVVFSDALGEGTRTSSGYSLLNLVKDQVIERSVEIDPFVEGRRPFVDFDIGDEIGVVFGTQAFAFRVLAIAISVDQNKKVKAEITLDYVLEAQRRRRLQLLNASSAGGGVASGAQTVYAVGGAVEAGATGVTILPVAVNAFVTTYGKVGFCLIGTLSQATSVVVDLLYGDTIIESFPYALAAGDHTVEATWFWANLPGGQGTARLRVRPIEGTFSMRSTQLWIEARNIAGAVGGTADFAIADAVIATPTSVTDAAVIVLDDSQIIDVTDSVVEEPYSVVDDISEGYDIVWGNDELVAVAADDGWIGPASFNAGGTSTQVGNVAGQSRSAWYRFVIPSDLTGVEIVAAWLEGYVVTTTLTPTTDIWAEDSAAPTAPTSRADYLARTRTSTSRGWSGGLTAGQTAVSPDFKEIVQELVDSYGDLDSILILHQDVASPTDRRFDFAAEEHASQPPMKLRIRYRYP